MKKWLARKNLFVIIILSLYCIFVWGFSASVKDVEISITTTEATGNGTVVQLFWDDGEGYNTEDNTQMEIVDTQGSLKVPKEVVADISAFRWDPTNVQQDIVYTSIAINGKNIELSEFASWIVSAEQVIVELTETGGRNKLVFRVGGNDSKIFLNEEFKNVVLQSTKLSTDTKGVLLVIGIVIAFIAFFYKEIFGGITWCFKKLDDTLADVYHTNGKLKTAICILVFGLATLIIMHQYLFGEKRFIFIDAADSYYQTYPDLLNTARYIEKGLLYNSFNFSKGLGAAQGVIKPTLANCAAWFGEGYIPYLMGISHALKIFLAGIFFYGFLRVKGSERWYSIILALGYAFCGHMTIRASWSSYPNEVLLLAFWLFAFELWFQRKDFRWILLATFVFFYNFSSSYYSFFYIALLGVYVAFRYITEKKVNVKLCVGVLIGVCIVTFCYLLVTDFGIVKQVLSIVESERAQSVLSTTDWSWNAFLPDMTQLPLILGRTVGMSILGIIGNNYVEGFWNFLEDPTFYCGIFTLLLIPLAFSSMNLKKKIWYGIAYIGMTIYCLSTPVRTIVNGFSGATYKQSSFWIIVVMLLTVAQIDWGHIRKERKEKQSFLVCTLTTIVLFWTTYRLPNMINTSRTELKISLCFIILEYIGLVGFLLIKDLKYCMKTVLIVVVCAETLTIAYPIYNNRITTDGSEYMDDTIEALEYINQMEEDSFYRIDKQYYSVETCDSLAQNYYGTAAYVGGTGIGTTFSAFYNDLNLPIFSLNRKVWGTSAYNDVQTLLGIKYALTKNSDIASYGYTEIEKVGEVSIYENKNAMPMGFVYSCAIERSVFETLDTNQRQKVLLEACLVEDGSSSLPLITTTQLQELNQSNDLFEQYEIPFESAENYSFVFETTTEEEVLAVQIAFDKSGQGNFFYSTVDGEVYKWVIPQDEGVSGQIYEIAMENVNRIWSDSPNWAEIIDLRIAKIPKSEYYATYEKDVTTLKESAVNVTNYRDNYISGNFETKIDGMLYLPIPNSGWQVYIDGELQNKQTINDAFIGVYVSAGSHTLEVIYPVGTFWSVYGSDIKILIVCVSIIVLGSIWMHMQRKRGLKNEGNISSSTSI